MARVEIGEVVDKAQAVLGPAGNVTARVVGAGLSVQVNVRGGAAGTVYQAATGAATWPNPLTSDANGRVEGWLEEGSYDLVVSGSGITTYTQQFEAVVSSGSYPAPAATGVLATDSANVLATIQAAAAGKGVCVIPKGKYVCAVDVAALSHVKIRGEGVLHCPTAGDDALSLTDCPDAEVEGIWVQGEAGSRNGIRLVRCPRAKVRVRCQGSGAEGVYAEKCIAIDVDSYVGIDVGSPFPAGVANSTGGVKLTWDGVNADSGCNQFRLGGWYVIGKDRGWAVEIVRAEGGQVASIVPELSKGGIKLDTCQNLVLDGYYGEANPSDVEYATGTASTTAASTAVTGTGTAWNTNDAQGNKNAMVGKFFIVGTTYGRVASITSDTAITLEANWGGSTASGQSYTLIGCDLYMRSCARCTVTGGRGGGAVILEGSSQNLLNLLAERVFFDAASNDNHGLVVTNRASTTTNPARLIDNGARNRITQVNYQTGALVKDDTARVGAANVFTVGQAVNGLADATVILSAIVSGQSAAKMALRNNGQLEAGDGVATRDTVLRRIQAAVWGIEGAGGTGAGFNFKPIAAASVPNNTIFMDSADNVLKRKDNTGAVAAI